MKSIKNLTYIILASFLFAACEKIVTVDLPSEDARLVVEGQITDERAPWQVRLTLSQPYFDQEEVDAIADAIVRIKGTDGVDILLNHTDTGMFVSPDTQQCVVGESYTLEIEYKGEFYEATESCKPSSTIDTIADFFLPPDVSFFPSGIYVFLQGEADPAQENYFLFKTYKNDTLRSQDLDDDEFGSVSLLNTGFDVTDIIGEVNRGFLPRPIIFDVKVNDTVVVEQFAISEKYYQFLIDLSIQQSRSGSPFDSPPANPNNNMSNGALGYFSVANKEVATLVIQE